MSGSLCKNGLVLGYTPIVFMFCSLGVLGFLTVFWYPTFDLRFLGTTVKTRALNSTACGRLGSRGRGDKEGYEVENLLLNAYSYILKWSSKDPRSWWAQEEKRLQDFQSDCIEIWCALGVTSSCQVG